MKDKKEVTIKRTDDLIMKTALSFFGANENLLILEEKYLEKNIITFPQYVNFLSQVALCIELGMKTILLNEGDIPKVHDLDVLYKKMPKAFRDMFENNPFPQKTITKYLEKIRNAFEDFRYMNTKHLDFFLDKSILTQDNKIILDQARRFQFFLFIIHLYDTIKNFYNQIYSIMDKSTLVSIGKKVLPNVKDNTVLLKAIHEYTEALKELQPQLVYSKTQKGIK